MKKGTEKCEGDPFCAGYNVTRYVFNTESSVFENFLPINISINSM